MSRNPWPSESVPQAERMGFVWTVLDSDGSRWWPSDEVIAELDRSDDPARDVVWICIEAPTRGHWRF